MAETKTVEVGSLKGGSYVIMDGAACIVRSIQTSKSGKHGSAKCRLEAVGILDNQKRVEIHPAHDNIQVPIIERKNAQVLSVHGDTASVMDMETYETFDLKIPEDMQNKIKDGGQVVYWVIMDQKVLMQTK